MGNNGFSMKEVVIEIKDDLKAFRVKYDEDQEKRDVEIAKRPTRTELYGSVTVVGVIVGIVISIVGG
ncbi:hypothetical protein LCGC14_2458180 [marine sediment metagenome]|uniref:Uncharacterized protein n=1 Tax=marine sediment metagenome TaxID=412755 RepID=A0A0F9E7X3_9ZZZZ